MYQGKALSLELAKSNNTETYIKVTGAFAALSLFAMIVVGVITFTGEVSAAVDSGKYDVHAASKY